MELEYTSVWENGEISFNDGVGYVGKYSKEESVKLRNLLIEAHGGIWTLQHNDYVLKVFIGTESEAENELERLRKEYYELNKSYFLLPNINYENYKKSHYWKATKMKVED
jgi:hypothetical protein